MVQRVNKDGTYDVIFKDGSYERRVPPARVRVFLAEDMRVVVDRYVCLRLTSNPASTTHPCCSGLPLPQRPTSDAKIQPYDPPLPQRPTPASTIQPCLNGPHLPQRPTPAAATTPALTAHTCRNGLPPPHSPPLTQRSGLMTYPCLNDPPLPRRPTPACRSMNHWPSGSSPSLAMSAVGAGQEAAGCPTCLAGFCMCIRGMEEPSQSSSKAA